MKVKVNEILELWLSDDDPLVALTGMSDLLRSMNQGETATLEGCLGSIQKYIEGGNKVSHKGLRDFFAKCPHLLELEIPINWLQQWLKSHDDEEKAERENEY